MIQLELPLLQQLGSRSLAERAVKIDDTSIGELDRLAGWRRVNSGMYRNVFRGPDGLVYKVSTDFEMQIEEVRIFHRYAMEPWCPAASLHVVSYNGYHRAVVVMPYFSNVGFGYGRMAEMDVISGQSGITDLCGSNVAVADHDQLVVIDAGNHNRSALPTDDQLLCPASCPCRDALSVPRSER